MNHGIWIRNTHDMAPETAVGYAVAADEAGWDGVFVSDSFSDGGYWDPIVLLSAMASRTERVALGTWVVPLARRQPWQVASDLATLDVLSEGRVLFGAGLGVPGDFDQFGLPPAPRDRAAMLDEALDVVDALWSGAEVDYDGDHYSLEGAQLPVTPVQEPRIPILLAGFWPNEAPFRRGARWDGMMPVWESYPEPIGEDDLREMVDYYRDHADEPGEMIIPGDLPGTPDDFASTAADAGVTWLLTTGVDDGYTLDLETIRAGPPTA